MIAWFLIQREGNLCDRKKEQHKKGNYTKGKVFEANSYLLSKHWLQNLDIVYKSSEVIPPKISHLDVRHRITSSNVSL